VFDTGNILYCENFQFHNGNQPKTKYFIVLKREADKLIIGSLPTRTNKIPNFIDVTHRCVNKDDRLFNCYLFQAKKPICDNGFCFDLPTFVYGDDAEIYNVQTVENNYKINVNYTVKGKLSDQEFAALISCFMNSNAVKNKIKRKLL